MWGFDPYSMGPFAAGLGGMQPQVPGLDPTFGVQMPQMPGYEQFQFDPRQNMNPALIQAGAAMLGSGDDFMGGLGRAGSVFGSMMQQGEDRARKIHEMDYQRAMDQYRYGRQGARDEIGDKRWGYGEETRISENREQELDAQREKDRETMARRERTQAAGDILGIAREPMESIDAYEVRIKEAEAKRTRQQELEDYRKKREYDAMGKTKGAQLTSTVISELQEASFVPASQPEFEEDDVAGRKAHDENVRREVEVQRRKGFAPKYSGKTLVGYEKSGQELRREAALAQKKMNGEPIMASDIPMEVEYNVEQAVASGRPLEDVINELITLGMVPDEAQKVVEPLIKEYGKELERRALEEKVGSGDSGFKGREMPGIQTLSPGEAVRLKTTGGVM